MAAENIVSLVPDSVWPNDNREKMLATLESIPPQIIQSREELWNRANKIFGPGMYHLALTNPTYTLLSDGTRICTVRAFLQVQAESKLHFCVQEVNGRSVIASGASAADEILAIQQAEDEALFQVFAIYGPQFQRDLPPQAEKVPGPVEQTPTPMKRPATTMKPSGLVQERTRQFQALTDFFEDQKEMPVFLAIYGLPQASDEWTEQHMNRISSYLADWCADISTDHPVGHQNWNTSKLDSQTARMNHILAAFGGPGLEKERKNAFVRRHMEALGFASIKDMNAGWQERLIQLLQSDPEYVTLQAASLKARAS